VSAHRSDVELLALHAVRLLGMATPAAAAARFGLDREAVGELLDDFAAYGWARHDEFAGTGGWSLTAAGRAQDERLLRDELELTGAAATVRDVHAAFLPLNARFQAVVTRWQIRPLPGDDLAANDHTDFRWDDRVVADLGALARRLTALSDELSSVLGRFDGYGRRFQDAADAARRGERRRVDGLGVDSCHRVWFELHEDLLATLGLERGAEPPVMR
jgi:hypothetical protein